MINKREFTILKKQFKSEMTEIVDIYTALVVRSETGLRIVKSGFINIRNGYEEAEAKVFKIFKNIHSGEVAEKLFPCEVKNEAHPILEAIIDANGRVEREQGIKMIIERMANYPDLLDANVFTINCVVGKIASYGNKPIVSFLVNKVDEKAKQGFYFDSKERELRYGNLFSKETKLESPVLAVTYPLYIGDDLEPQTGEILYYTKSKNKPDWKFLLETFGVDKAFFTSEQEQVIFEEILLSTYNNKLSTQLLSTIFTEINSTMEGLDEITLPSLQKLLVKCGADGDRFEEAVKKILKDIPVKAFNISNIVPPQRVVINDAANGFKIEVNTGLISNIQQTIVGDQKYLMIRVENDIRTGGVELLEYNNLK